MRLYIAGPMSGLPDFNYPAFFAAADALREAGHQPINPARQRPGVKCATWQDFMRESLRDIADCDGIATLPGSHNSRGARLEIRLAHDLDLPVRTLAAWLDPTPDPARAVCRDETTTTAEEATNA